MISALRRRFIWGGMIALLILLLLLIGSLGIITYINTEHNDEVFITSVLNGDVSTNRVPKMNSNITWPAPDDTTSPFQTHRSFYLATVNIDEEITDISSRGIWNENIDEARKLFQLALNTGKTRGHLTGQYKFGYQSTEEGGLIVLLDDFQEYSIMVNMLENAALLSLVSLIIMFLILLPVSSQVVRSYAANAEKQKQFITNAGHELKTPLAIILSNLDAMELIAGENKWSKNIRTQSNRLNTLLYRLLSMARMDEKGMNVKREKLDISELIKTESIVYSSIFEEKNLRVTSILSSQMIWGHREYLNQLLHIMMENAVQYTPENGWIKIAVTRLRHRISITFENSVEALPACTPDLLFERFYRGDTSHSQSGGHGIGLSAAMAISEMHGGNIHAEYGDNCIRFTIELKAVK